MSFDDLDRADHGDEADDGPAISTVVGPSTLRIEDEHVAWAMTFPSNWVVADLDDPAWLDDVGDAVVAATVQWLNELSGVIGERVIMPDPGDELIGTVTGVQADIVSGFRSLTDDAPASALLYGVDVLGPEAEVMTTVCSLMVVDDVGFPAESETRCDVVTDDDGEPHDLGVGQWSVPAPETGTTLVVRASALGPAAADMLEVVARLAATATAVPATTATASGPSTIGGDDTSGGTIDG